MMERRRPWRFFDLAGRIAMVMGSPRGPDHLLMIREVYHGIHL